MATIQEVVAEAQQGAQALLDKLSQAAVEQAGSDAPAPTTRPGIRTTEFWLSFASVALIQWSVTRFPEGSPFAPLAPFAGVIGQALIAMGYSLSRSKVKGSAASGS